MNTQNGKRIMFPESLEIQSGDTLYKVKSIYADKGDFCALWDEMIINFLLTEAKCLAS
jgi:hypothetical protein